jgi:hypothetical protein
MPVAPATDRHGQMPTQTLQAALNHPGLTSGDQIWVANTGEYKPGTTATASFALRPGVAVLGGFVGSETSVTQRNPLLNETVLSGDLGNSVRAYHVVTAGSNVTPPSAITGTLYPGNLEGFTITLGSATGTGTNQKLGGGIFIDQGAPRIRNCLFTENYADVAGGAGYCLNTATGPEFRNTRFIENGVPHSFEGGNGGALAGNYSLSVINSLFQGNDAYQGGGFTLAKQSLPR